MDEPTILNVLPVPPHACPEDPAHHPGMRLYVGVSITHEVVGERKAWHLVGGKPREVTTPKTRAVFPLESFSTTPVRVPNTTYYQERVRHGDLRAADAATAAACGVTFAAPKPAPVEQPRRGRPTADVKE